MGHSDNPILEKVYAARTNADRREAYNAWAKDYDRDVSAFGIRLPYVGATVFSRFVDIGTGPILDAGCGTGMHTIPLALMGYGPFNGIDISDEMLALADKLEIYASLQRMALGEPLIFDTDHFAITYAIGVLAPGNAPPHSLDEFIRVTKPGGLVIWSTHAHENERTRPFHDHRHSLSEQGKWSIEFETKPFISMPGGDPDIKHAIYVYRVL
jgi:ubiquinone/menaquinone biosynthesis C-methylase UbiE